MSQPEQGLQPEEVFLPSEQIEDILSCLPVKTLLRLRSTCKWCNNLIISNPFLQMHLHKSSARNRRLIQEISSCSTKKSPPLVTGSELCRREAVRAYLIENQGVIPLSMHISRILESSSTNFQERPCSRTGRPWHITGSCNGLICLVQDSTRFCLWNPATRTISNAISSLSSDKFKFCIGYDISSAAYKVVAFRVKKVITCDNEFSINEVKVFTFGDNNSWRTIQCFPVIPLYWYLLLERNNGVYLNGTLNWLGICNCVHTRITAGQYVILSLDLSTETYTQLQLPLGVDDLPLCQPVIRVLQDSLCFSHEYKRTHFVVWQMKDFGVHDSWIQLLAIPFTDIDPSFNTLRSEQFLPLWSFENGDAMIWVNDDLIIIYNRKENTTKRATITGSILWSMLNNYVESLASTK